MKYWKDKAIFLEDTTTTLRRQIEEQERQARLGTSEHQRMVSKLQETIRALRTKQGSSCSEMLVSDSSVLVGKGSAAERARARPTSAPAARVVANRAASPPTHTHGMAEGSAVSRMESKHSEANSRHSASLAGLFLSDLCLCSIVL